MPFFIDNSKNFPNLSNGDHYEWPDIALNISKIDYKTNL